MSHIVVAYAIPQRQVELMVEAHEACLVADVIERSGLLSMFPDIDLDKQPVGINSKKCDLRSQVLPGQRVEVYRALTLDPNEARLQRAKVKSQS